MLSASVSGRNGKSHRTSSQVKVIPHPWNRFKMSPPIVDLATSVQKVAEHIAVIILMPAMMDVFRSWKGLTCPKAYTMAADTTATAITIHFSRNTLSRATGWLNKSGSVPCWNSIPSGIVANNGIAIKKVFEVMNHSPGESYGRSQVMTPANITAHQGQSIARASLRILENCRSIQRLLVSRRRDKDFLQCQGFGS